MTGSDAAGLLLSLRSPTLSPPKGPAALSPSPEPRQSFISRDSALEDLGLWDFGTEGGGEIFKLSKLLSPGVPWAGGGKRL